MTIWTTGGDGIEALTIAADPTPDFRPLQGNGSAVSSSWMWQVLPDDLLDLPPRDRAFMESAWNAGIQALGAAMTEVAHLDQMASLLDFPIRLQRKWLRLDLWKTYELGSGDPAATYKLRNKRGSRVFDAPAAADTTTLELTQGGSHRGVSIDLTSRFDSRASAAFRINLGLGGPVVTPDLVGTGLPELVSGEESWVVCGYGDLTSNRWAPGAYAAVSTQGRVAAVLVDTSDRAYIAVGAQRIGTDELQDFTLEVNLEADVESRGPRVVARVGDIEVGVQEAFEAGGYVVSQFVVSSWDTRIENQRPYTELTPNAIRQPFTVRLGTLELGDPSLDPRVVAVPSVQQRVSDESVTEIRGRDYDIHRFKSGAQLSFRQFPDTDRFAEHVGFDAGLLQRIWGALIGDDIVSGPDTPELRNQIVALLNGFLAGPNPSALASAIGALGGCPVAEERGVVIAIDTADPNPVIVVRGRFRDRLYRYNPAVQPVVRVGQEVEALDPLTQTAGLLDWTSEFFVDRTSSFLEAEIEKFGAVLLELPFPVDTELRERIVAYARKAFGIWTDVTRFIVAVVASISEDLGIIESLRHDKLAILRDALTNARDPRYNDSRGFVYDGTTPYNEADAELGALRLGVDIENTGGAPMTVDVFGSPQTIAPGATESYLEPLPP